MKIFALIFYILPVACFASSENVDHVFIKAFQAAIATSLCADLATVVSDTPPTKEFETLIKICKKKEDQSRAILDAYTNAKRT
ncbi:TPA: hypothetical protein ACQJIG_004181 [Escherichia coli]